MFSNLSALRVEDRIPIAIETANILAELGLGTLRVVHTLQSAEKRVLAERSGLALVDMDLGNGERTNLYNTQRARPPCGARPATPSVNSAHVFRHLIFFKSLLRRGILSAPLPILLRSKCPLGSRHKKPANPKVRR